MTQPVAGGWKNVYAGDEPDPEKLAAAGLDEMQAKGVPTELPKGIVYQAPWRKENDGMAHHGSPNGYEQFLWNLQ